MYVVTTTIARSFLIFNLYKYTFFYELEIRIMSNELGVIKLRIAEFGLRNDSIAECGFQIRIAECEKSNGVEEFGVRRKWLRYSELNSSAT